jgi:DNA-binding beta-propeller fold protein YncE
MTPARLGVLLSLLGIAGCELDPGQRAPRVAARNDPPDFYTTTVVDQRLVISLVEFRPDSEDVAVIPLRLPLAPISLSKDDRRFGTPLSTLGFGDRLFMPNYSFSFPSPGGTGIRYGVPKPGREAEADPTLLFALEEAGLVYALNPVARTLTGQVRTGSNPRGIIRLTASTAAVAVQSPPALQIFDTSTLTVSDSIPLPASSRPYAAEITRDGARAWVTSFLADSASIYTVDASGRRLLATLPAGGFPADVSLTPDESQLWVSVYFDDAVYVFDTLTNSLAYRINGIRNPRGIAFNDIGTRAYVVSSTETVGTVKVIDTATFDILGSIGVGNGPTQIGPNPVSGRHLFVTNFGSDYVSQIDLAAGTELRQIRTGAKNSGLGFYWK